MKKFILNMVSDGSEISVKRVLTFIAALLLFVEFILNMFWQFSVTDVIRTGVESIVWGGFGGTVVEKFAKGKPAATPPVE